MFAGDTPPIEEIRLLNRGEYTEYQTRFVIEMSRELWHETVNTPIWQLAKNFINHVMGLTREPNLDMLLPEAIKDALRYCLLPEIFEPGLDRSFLPLGLSGYKGKIQQFALIAPGIIDFDQSFLSQLPGNIKDYDVTFPITSMPFSSLRQQSDWGTFRIYRALGVLPFLFSHHSHLWSERSSYFKELYKTDHILALFPPMPLWEKPFLTWTEDDEKQCISALWDIQSGDVLWASGVHTEKSIREQGKPIREFLGVV